MNEPSTGDKDSVILLLDGAYASRVNNLTRSIELAEKALTISRKLEDKALVGKSLNQLSLYFMIKGEYKQCESMAKEAMSCFEELEDERGIAEAKYNIGGIYYRTDNYHMGLVYLIDCLNIYRKFDDYHNQSRVEKSLGTIYEYFGDQKNAVKAYENAIEAARKAGDLNLESNAYNPLSGIYLKQGKTEEALEIIEKSIAMKKQTGDIRGMAFAIYGRAKVYTKTRRFAEAEEDFQQAIAIHQEMGERLGLGMAYQKLGVLYFETGRLEEARKAAEKGVEFSKAYNIVIIKFKCKYLLYQIYKQENNPVKALEYLEKYLAEKETVINTQTLKIIENYELITRMEFLEKEAQAQREKAEIIEKKNRAEEAARIKQEFLSTMSHEIRTPLNAVITITSLLAEKNDDDEQQLVDSLKFASNNLLLIINDILDFTKLDSGKVHLEMRPTHFIPLMEGIRHTYETLAKEKGLRLELKVDKAAAVSYELDETKISQIIGNLVSNAIKFTETGEVGIVIEKMEGMGDYDMLRFKITDTGEGIAEHNLEEIFESFSQPRSVTTRKQGGSGLGLAIVKKLVELYGSHIYVKSTVGKGSEFYFDIKLKKTELPGKAPQKTAHQLKDKTVLLAEDNKVNAMVAMRLLSNWGVSTEHAENGLLAVEKAREKKFDYILMDIHMPEMNGFDAAKQIREIENPNKQTPIYALTADITAENQDEYLSYFNCFLRKPIEVDKLYEALVTS